MLFLIISFFCLFSLLVDVLLYCFLKLLINNPQRVISFLLSVGISSRCFDMTAVDRRLALIAHPLPIHVDVKMMTAVPWFVTCVLMSTTKPRFQIAVGQNLIWLNVNQSSASWSSDSFSISLFHINLTDWQPAEVTTLGKVTYKPQRNVGLLLHDGWKTTTNLSHMLVLLNTLTATGAANLPSSCYQVWVTIYCLYWLRVLFSSPRGQQGAVYWGAGELGE